MYPPILETALSVSDKAPQKAFAMSNATLWRNIHIVVCIEVNKSPQLSKHHNFLRGIGNSTSQDWSQTRKMHQLKF